MSANDRPGALLLAGFGDDPSMYSGLLETPLAARVELTPIALPGFGAPALAGPTSLAALAAFVADAARERGAGIAIAHSLASIIASLAAGQPGCPITRIVSLEGNLTAEDAYFSGTAADYDDPDAFRAAFLDRLDERSAAEPVIARYRRIVARADPRALWELGSDARRFSDEHVPGDVLVSAARATYVYAPGNCPNSTLEWLERSPIERIVLEGASHWVSVDQPERLSRHLVSALATAP
ncbi:MAG: alpha/beta fold hydrolase [Myxococcota bacterium]|nr:alpha/beta fold hydrolase [Myxococcota bacterium]